ncbi:fibroin heavy chain-like [Uloborus diversus]|uniref:fibroin heavy chain-like n=1 Tax=Uloborus diversus TaxID=327109 RepID=UPI002409ACF9|nr:fibroin heavy chain-like [Uloborus diversus]
MRSALKIHINRASCIYCFIILSSDCNLLQKVFFTTQMAAFTQLVIYIAVAMLFNHLTANAVPLEQKERPFDLNNGGSSEKAVGSKSTADALSKTASKQETASNSEFSTGTQESHNSGSGTGSDVRRAKTGADAGAGAGAGASGGFGFGMNAGGNVGSGVGAGS